MAWQLLAILGGSSLLGVALWLASKNGSKAAQLEALKAELKKQAEEQKRANKIMDSVRNMPSNDVRKRLQDIPSK
jgi:hypothetical protein